MKHKFPPDDILEMKELIDDLTKWVNDRKPNMTPHIAITLLAFKATMIAMNQIPMGWDTNDVRDFLFKFIESVIQLREEGKI